MMRPVPRPLDERQYAFYRVRVGETLRVSLAMVDDQVPKRPLDCAIAPVFVCDQKGTIGGPQCS